MAAARNSGLLTDEEHYFRLLVLQEERHRRLTVLPLVYQSVLNGWITVISLAGYSFVILLIVGIYFPMDSNQFISFAFSLVATATVSEADKLMQVVKKKKVGNASLSTDRVPAIGQVGGGGGKNGKGKKGGGGGGGGSAGGAGGGGGRGRGLDV